jgi:hypothetical protein
MDVAADSVFRVTPADIFALTISPQRLIMVTLAAQVSSTHACRLSILSQNPARPGMMNDN